MTLVLAILPIAMLVVLMTCPRPRGWLPLPAHLALPAVAILAYALCRLSPSGTSDILIHAAVIDGVLSALTPLAIVFGAVLLFKTMEKSGAMDVVASRLRHLSPDPVAQLMLVGWSFSFLVEGLSGFGTPAALAAPILVGLGFPALRVAAMCLIMNSVPVSFGAVGTPTWFGLGGVGLTSPELIEIGWRTSLIHAAAAPVIAVLALLVVVPWSQVRPRVAFVLLVVGSSVGPYVLTAFLSAEFPSIVGGLCSLICTVALARWRVGVPIATTLGESTPGEPTALSGDTRSLDNLAGAEASRASPLPMPFWRAVLPIAAVVTILAVTRIDALGVKALLTSDAGSGGFTIPGLGELWISPALVVGLRGILDTGTDWRMPLLYVPFILPFVVVALAAIPILRITPNDARSTWMETLQRMTKPAIALFGALVLTKLMTVGGDAAPAMRMGKAMADATGPAWPQVAPLLGALGSFFSGSNTVSNLTFAPIQNAIAQTLGLDRLSVLALQSAGGAMGNMICIHNIVAVAAVLGLAEKPGPDRQQGSVPSILRLTIGPLLAYAAIASIMAGVLRAIG